jgi:hypothetical protein
MLGLGPALCGTGFGSPPAAAARAQTTAPKVGDPAIEFELPDIRGTNHKMSAFKGEGPLVLSFFCGCEECTRFAANLARAAKGAEKPPTFLAVMTAHWEPSATPAFVRRTGTQDWNYLFAWRNPQVVTRYNGSPCPRAYIIDTDLKVTYVSPRPRTGQATALANSVAKQLGLAPGTAAAPAPTR